MEPSNVWVIRCVSALSYLPPAPGIDTHHKPKYTIALPYSLARLTPPRREETGSELVGKTNPSTAYNENNVSKVICTSTHTVKMPKSIV